MESIVVENASQVYTDSHGDLFTALDQVSLTWNHGESVGIMGESGSGKSTLARMIAGLERPASGRVLLDGKDTSTWKSRDWLACRMELQAVFQDAAGTLSPGRSVLQNAEEALCNLTELSKSQRKDKILSLMEQMDLKPDILSVPVSRLSGGEQRRIGLLRSLAVEPRFLVLDEVTAGLDLISAEAVLKVLQTYKEQHDCEYLLITHDLSTASRLCNRLFEIDHGHIIHESVR